MKIVMFQPLITRKENEKTFQIYLQHISLYDDITGENSHIYFSTSPPMRTDGILNPQSSTSAARETAAVVI